MAVMYVLYALKLKLYLRSNPVSKSFLLRKFVIDQGPRRGFTIRLKRLQPRGPDLRGGPKVWE